MGGRYKNNEMNNLKKEDGYILIVIVGILTVFSLMAITFATLSRLETKAARNYADSVKCEAVAKAGLEHAIYTIRLDKFGTDTIAYNDDGGGDTNYDYSGDPSWPGDGIFDGSDYDNDGDSTNDSKWVYFPATTSAFDIRLPGSLRARYAVLITDDREARLNINATGNRSGGGAHTSNEGWSTFEIDLSDLIEREVGNGGNIANDIIDARHGADLAPGVDDINDDLTKIPAPQDDGIDNDGDWNTGDDSNNNGIPDLPEANINELDEYEDEPGEFHPISPLGDDVPFDILAEVEIMDTSAYTSELEGIFTTRGILPDAQEAFKGYLTTYSADTILCPEYTLEGVGTSTKLNINALVYNEGAYAGATSDRKVNMIIDVLTAGGVQDVELQQMAVNIIDFMDSNSIVTTYNDGSNTYYGIERTPYINEVEAAKDGKGDPEYIELFNPYDAEIPIGEWTIVGPGLGTVIIDVGAEIPGGPTGGYYVIASKSEAGVDQEYGGIKNLAQGGEELILSDSSGNIVQRTNYGGGKNNSSQLNDPRPIPLSASAADPWFWESGAPTFGTKNTNFRPEDGDDDWDDTTPTWPASFLIPNRRFSNKGYLGFIHRGEEWSSFRVGDTGSHQMAYPNLLQYITITDPSMDGIDNDGDGSTDSDDTGLQAGDIDGPEYRIPGLINVNTASVEVLESLPNVDNAIASGIANPAGKPYESIGDLVKNVTQITAGDTKWEEEETIRSISNLITTRSNVFTVYVTAQVTDEADPPNTKVFAEKRIMAIVDRSVDPIRVRYFRWITE
jgi:type II secretory pathway component PulK